MPKFAPSLILALLPITSVFAQSLGSAFSYQGRLTESGQPASGLYDIQACLFETGNSVPELACAPIVDDVPVENGVFTVTIDFGSAAFSGQQRFLELRVRPGASSNPPVRLLPRQAIRPVPEALRAANAPWSGLSDIPAGFADGIDNNSGGTITSISAGTGLSGGTITGSGTLAIAPGGVGSAQIAAGAVGGVQLAVNAVGSSALADNAVDTAAVQNLAITQPKIAAGAVGLGQINTSQVQARITGNCATGEYVRGISADGSLVCESVLGYLGINLISVPMQRYSESNLGLSMAIGADGLPVIAAETGGGEQSRLMVVKCANSACTGSALVTTVDSAGSGVGRFPTIAVAADGLPVISYYDQVADALRVAKCADSACAAPATITVVDDPVNNVGFKSSITIGADGLPVISYSDSTAGTLKVAKCANAACTGVATITTVDDPVNAVGADNDIVVGPDGLPVISYVDATAGALKVAKCANPACTGVATITTVDNPTGAVTSTSITIAATGFPAISYHRAADGDLAVARCANAACTSISAANLVIDGAGIVGTDSSIATLPDGRLIISYRDTTNNGLKVASCVRRDVGVPCSFGFQLASVDSDGGASIGRLTSLAIGADGLPVIAYRDDTRGDLRVIKCGDRGCL